MPATDSERNGEETIGVTRPHELTWVPDALIDDELLGKNELLVYFALARHAGHEGTCYPAIRTIMREARLASSTVQKALVVLEAAGYIERRRRFNAKKPKEHEVTLYALLDKRKHNQKGVSASDTPV